MSDKENGQGMSRRQFLTYTLMGTGAFMAAGILTPMLRFAVDPALKGTSSAGKVEVGKVDDFGPEYKLVKFKVKIKDGWHEEEAEKSAYIRNKDGKILALSPICKHLGCQVQWNTDKDHPNRFYCPCHNGLYDENGINVPGTPPQAPLDEYEVEVKNGKVLLSLTPKPRGGA